MRMKKKGQVALEFLMTYGWAFLIILVVIGAFVYFDVLNPSQQIPGRCQMSAGMYCSAYTISPTQIQLELRNDKGTQITIDAVTIDGSLEGMTGSTSCTFAPAIISNGDITTIDCTMDDLPAGERYQGDVEITYTKRGTSLPQTQLGSISGPIIG